MDSQQMAELGRMGALAAVGLGGLGSAVGVSIAGRAAVGAWKKAYALGRPAPFTLMTFIGAPMSQTIYGMILMFTMIGKADSGYDPFALLGVGFFAGLAIGVSAWMQGAAGAACADALAETGEGFTNYLSVIGIVETVAIFVMVFTIIAL
mgnify:FL=1